MKGEGKHPALLIEQLALGVIDAGDERALRAQLSPEQIERHLSQLQSEEAAFVREHDLAQGLAEIARRQRANASRVASTPKRTRFTWTLVPALCVAGALLWSVNGPTRDRLDSIAPMEIDDGTRVKGLGPYLLVFRHQGPQVEPLSKGARVKAGDLLQLGYVAADAAHGVILSIDGRGQVNLHFPDHETSSTRLTGKEEQWLDHAYELDQAPAFEHFVFVTSATAIDVELVLTRARELAQTLDRVPKTTLALPTSLQQRAFTLVKE